MVVEMLMVMEKTGGGGGGGGDTFWTFISTVFYIFLGIIMLPFALALYPLSAIVYVWYGDLQSRDDWCVTSINAPPVRRWKQFLANLLLKIL
jgi:hypothetical protein